MQIFLLADMPIDAWRRLIWFYHMLTVHDDYKLDYRTLGILRYCRLDRGAKAIYWDILNWFCDIELNEETYFDWKQDVYISFLYQSLAALRDESYLGMSINTDTLEQLNAPVEYIKFEDIIVTLEDIQRNVFILTLEHVGTKGGSPLSYHNIVSKFIKHNLAIISLSDGHN